MTNRQAFKLSAIIDKIDIKISNPKGSLEEVGADVMLQLAKKAYKAENEILQLVADVKGCTVEDAASLDFVQTIKDLMNDPSILGFFKSAVKSNTQG